MPKENYTKKVMEMLLAGRLEEANAFVEGDVSQQISQRELELQADIQERSLLRAMVAHFNNGPNRTGILAHGRAEQIETHPGLNQAAKWPFPTSYQSDLQKMPMHERREIVKRIAMEIQDKDGIVRVQDIIERLKADGINLGIGVPGTAIGNILNHSGDWTRLERGVFKSDLIG